jgi:TPR repeat protein
MEVKMNCKKLFGCLAWLAVVCVMPVLSGCVTAGIAMAQKLDQSQMRREATANRKKQVEIIKALQAKGDPMGDYLYGMANAEGWWPENPITDPLAIKEIYEKAAAKGSSDAMIVLGLMLISTLPAPQMSKIPPLEFKDRDQQKGLELIEKGMNIRCFYIQPTAIIGAGESSCFAERSPAIWIAPIFRDGDRFFEKNQKKANEWYTHDKLCNTYIKSTPPMMRCF